MIQLYTWKTPNGRKVPILLEELELPYDLRPVDLSRGEQRSPSFLALNPNGKIPVLVDDEGPAGKTVVFESGAILMYLAEKTGRFLPTAGPARYAALSWLFFQVGGVGPMFGQAAAFARAPVKNGPAIEKFLGETERHLGVLERGLNGRDYLAGDYSIADMATYPWVEGAFAILPGLGHYPHVREWCARLSGRPAVVRGMATLA